MMSRQLLILMILITLVMSSLARKKRSIIGDDRGNYTNNCVGSLQLITSTGTTILTMSMTSMLVKNIARVVVQGTCCATIYSGRYYRGKSRRLSGQGEFFTMFRRVRSVRLTNC